MSQERMAPATPAPAGGRTPEAILDTSVLYPKSIRGLLILGAAAGAYRPGWSEPILSELHNNLPGKERMSRAAWRTLEETLRDGFPEAMVDTKAIRVLETSMPNEARDRHVLAAAVASGASTVVTTNLRHFRSEDLARVGVRAAHPDAFLSQLMTRSPAAMSEAISQQAQMMGRGWSEGQLLGHLAGLGRANAMAPQFARQAEAHLGVRAVTPPPPETSLSRPGLERSRGHESRGR